jgi:uncharacterized membrane protein
MTVSPGWYGPEPHDYSGMLASTADRERALDVLKAGFAEGRLTKDEYDDRVSSVQAARTYADLVMVTGDLPGGQQAVMPGWPPAAPVWQPSQGTNGFALASLICGIGQLVTLGLTGIPAIILGHTALHRISRTGEDGNGLAVAGVTLGWIGLPITAFIWLLVFIFVSHMPG